MMTWAVIAMVAGLAWVVYGPVLRRSSAARTLHFRNGVCEENEIGVWKYLRHLGLRRELGKELWPEGHDRVQTAEYGAYRPPRVDVYYWMDFPIWEQNRRPYGTQGAPEDYSFRYAVIAIVLAVVVPIAC